MRNSPLTSEVVELLLLEEALLELKALVGDEVCDSSQLFDMLLHFLLHLYLLRS